MIFARSQPFPTPSCQRLWLTAPVVQAPVGSAGQSAGIVKDVLPAATIVDELVSGAAEALTCPYPERTRSRP